MGFPLAALGGLMGGSGGGSTKVSNSVSNSVGSAINPNIGISIGGDVAGDSSGDAKSTPTATALAYGEQPSTMGAMGFGSIPGLSDPAYAASPDVTGGATDFGGGLLSNPLVWLGVAGAVGFLIWKG